MDVWKDGSWAAIVGSDERAIRWVRRLRTAAAMDAMAEAAEEIRATARGGATAAILERTDAAR